MRSGAVRGTDDFERDLVSDSFRVGGGFASSSLAPRWPNSEVIVTGAGLRGLVELVRSGAVRGADDFEWDLLVLVPDSFRVGGGIFASLSLLLSRIIGADFGTFVEALRLGFGWLLEDVVGAGSDSMARRF